MTRQQLSLSPDTQNLNSKASVTHQDGCSQGGALILCGPPSRALHVGLVEVKQQSPCVLYLRCIHDDGDWKCVQTDCALIDSYWNRVILDHLLRLAERLQLRL